MDLSAIVIAVGAGIAIGIPTGPARFFVVDTRLNEGKAAALKTYGGFFSAVLIYAALALLADNFLSRYAQTEAIAYVIASILLIFWGIVIVLKSNNTQKSALNFSFKSPFLKGFAAGLSSPVSPFIYLALLQVLDSYTDNFSLFEKAISVAIFEACSFLTTWTVGGLLVHKKKEVQKNWRMVKIIMGIFLIVLGTYNLVQHVDFKQVIHLEQKTAKQNNPALHIDLLGP